MCKCGYHEKPICRTKAIARAMAACIDKRENRNRNTSNNVSLCLQQLLEELGSMQRLKLSEALRDAWGIGRS